MRACVRVRVRRSERRRSRALAPALIPPSSCAQPIHYSTFAIPAAISPRGLAAVPSLLPAYLVAFRALCARPAFSFRDAIFLPPLIIGDIFHYFPASRPYLAPFGPGQRFMAGEQVGRTPRGAPHAHLIASMPI